MNAYLRSHLGAKLFLSYLAIIVVGVVVLILASQFSIVIWLGWAWATAT
jgi:hypothetical protein